MVVDNRIRPFVRTEIAKMTKTRPKFVAVPKSQADQDIAAARYAEQALDDAWKRHNLHRKLRQALLWARITGRGSGRCGGTRAADRRATSSSTATTTRRPGRSSGTGTAPR
jgi:hypothetical protein